MRRFVYVGMLCLAVMAFCSLAVGAQQSDSRLITVNGEAQVNVVPDEIIVSIGVQAAGDTASEARNKEAVLARALMGVANEVGVDPKLVRTDAIEIDLVKPEYYDWRICYETNQPRKYGARQMVNFTIKDVEKLTPLLTRALEVGATKVLGVEFRTTKLRQFRDQARSMAIKAAREKAVAMAGDLGQKVGRPHSITESPYYGRDWYYYGSWWGYRSFGGGANVSQNMASDSGGGRSSEDLAIGQIGVTAQVTVSFELE